jgi:dihydroorotate dehydrogenase electron transfer subunit
MMPTPGSKAIGNAQRNRSTIFVEDGELLDVQRFPGEQYIQRIRAERTAANAMPGSFVHVTCADALPMRRPLSIMRCGDDWIEILFKNVGEGLRALSRKQPGDTISILGPIGQGFRPDPQRPHCLLIGGGVGIPPMVFLADTLRADARFETRAILGSELPFPFETGRTALDFPGIDAAHFSTMPLLDEWGVATRLTSLSGFPGCHRGFVTELADHWLGQLPAAQLARVKIFSCGPTPMLKAVAELAARYSIACEVSLEEFMACAVGGCAGCVVEISTAKGPAMKRVCVDGPVFDADTVSWQATASPPAIAAQR